MTHALRLTIYLDFDRFHRFISEDTSPSKIYAELRMQKVNLLTTEVQLRVEGTFINILFIKQLSLLKKYLKKSFMSSSDGLYWPGL